MDILLVHVITWMTKGSVNTSISVILVNACTFNT